IPRGGTDIGGAILTAVRAFEGHERKHRVVFLLTDGEDHAGKVMEAVEEAKKAGAIIFTISIGRAEGGPIPFIDEDGHKSFIKDEDGNVVISKADQIILQKIALMTGGKKGTIGAGQFPLEELYENEVGKMEKKELESTRQKRFENRFQWPLFAAMILLVIEAIMSERKGQFRWKSTKIL
ncbi:MAG: VWA domain-containing protein, partial [Chlamydiota bacterium]|nr:VWA domain-containing protein [Chlamydiota bacterium]